jgi:hypothetical protein
MYHIYRPGKAKAQMYRIYRPGKASSFYYAILHASRDPGEVRDS